MGLWQWIWDPRGVAESKKETYQDICPWNYLLWSVEWSEMESGRFKARGIAQFKGVETYWYVFFRWPMYSRTMAQEWGTSFLPTAARTRSSGQDGMEFVSQTAVLRYVQRWTHRSLGLISVQLSAFCLTLQNCTKSYLPYTLFICIHFPL